MDRHNDKALVAYLSPTGYEGFFVFDFMGLKPGSPARACRCDEYHRMIEALEGQGCQISRGAPGYPPARRWKPFTEE